MTSVMNQPMVTVCRIDDESSLPAARSTLRAVATELGFGVIAQTKLVTAASELARNILRYAGTGLMAIEPVEQNGKVGVQARFEDHGPGIADLNLAMEDGYSSSGSLGIGLPGARRLVDEFKIESDPSVGTVVTITTWRT